MKREKSEKKPRKLKKLNSISMAMWGYFCLLAFFLIVIVELVYFFTTFNTLEDQAREKISFIGKEITHDLAYDPNMPDKDCELILEQSVRRYRREGVNVYLADTDGNIVAPKYYGDDDLINELKEKIGDNETGDYIIYRKDTVLNYASKIEYAGEPHLLLVNYSVATVRETVGNLQIYLLVIGIMVFLLSLVISFALSNKLTRGLQNMSDSAVKLAKKDYSVEFTNVDYKEMAQLSESLNYVRDEVKKSEDFQREILANVTHDLKTPLTMIKAYASMIKEISGDNPEKREKHLQVIIDEADRLTGLVNDVLSVSKLSSNIDEINCKVINLTELLYGIINRFGYLQEAQGYNFMVDIDANLYTRADEEKIRQVIYNLLGNAANYTGADKTVYISLKASLDGQRIKFSVRDTGKGIAKEDLPEIWNRYYRVKENHTRPVKGTGLGLNIVKAILESHSFDYGVESEVGQGSTFWVDFPAVSAEIETEE